MVEALGQNGITTLNQLADPRPPEPWNKHWRRANSLGLGDRETAFMDLYIRELDRANILLTDHEDTLFGRRIREVFTLQRLVIYALVQERYEGKKSGGGGLCGG